MLPSIAVPQEALMMNVCMETSIEKSSEQSSHGPEEVLEEWALQASSGDDGPIMRI